MWFLFIMIGSDRGIMLRRGKTPRSCMNLKGSLI